MEVLDVGYSDASTAEITPCQALARTEMDFQFRNI
jgi:hypothetical protein